MSCKNCKCDTEMSEDIKELNRLNDILKVQDNEDDNYDPEQWKIEITKVGNGYIIKNKSENSVMVIEEDGDNTEGLANMLYCLAYEFGSGYRLEINTLEDKHDYLKEDFKMMLEDVYKSYNEDDHDVTSGTMEQLEDMFGKFSWRDKDDK